MAYKISTTHQFEKDLKRCIKRGYPMDEFFAERSDQRSSVAPSSSCLNATDDCPKFTGHTCSTATAKANGSATSNPTGC